MQITSISKGISFSNFEKIPVKVLFKKIYCVTTHMQRDTSYGIIQVFNYKCQKLQKVSSSLTDCKIHSIFVQNSLLYCLSLAVLFRVQIVLQIFDIRSGKLLNQLRKTVDREFGKKSVSLIKLLKVEDGKILFKQKNIFYCVDFNEIEGKKCIVS